MTYVKNTYDSLYQFLMIINTFNK